MADVLKHTPGPWAVEYDETITNSDEFYSVKANGLYIVSLFKSGTSPEDEHSPEAEDEVRANAHLIAAAPDLLSLVDQYRSDLRHPPAPDSINRRLEAIEAVLAKVEGRS